MLGLQSCLQYRFVQWIRLLTGGVSYNDRHGCDAGGVSFAKGTLSQRDKLKVELDRITELGVTDPMPWVNGGLWYMLRSASSHQSLMFKITFWLSTVRQKYSTPKLNNCSKV